MDEDFDRIYKYSDIFLQLAKEDEKIEQIERLNDNFLLTRGSEGAYVDILFDQGVEYGNG